MSATTLKTADALEAWGSGPPPWKGLRMLTKDCLWEFDGSTWQLLAEGEQACERFNHAE